MYDNVNLKLEMDKLSQDELLRFKSELQYLNTSYRLEEHITERFKSKKHLFEVSISKNILRIKKLSLPVLIYGTNEMNFDFKATQSAIDKLKEITGLPIEKAIVTRIDIAANLEVTHKPIEYFSVLDKSRNFSLRITYPNSLNYQQKTNKKRLIFYDKKIERKEKGYILKNEFENSLRYELKLLSSPHKQLKINQIYFAQLTEKNLQRRLIELWKKEFENIRIIEKTNQFLDYPFSTPKEVIEYLAWQQLTSEQCRTTTFQKIDSWYSSGTIGYKFKENFYAKLNQLNTKYNDYQLIHSNNQKPLGMELKDLVMNKFNLLIGGVK